MHLGPHATEPQHPKIHDQLPTFDAPGHPRLFQALREDCLARCLRHPTADRQVTLTVPSIVQMREPLRQVIIRRLELLFRSLEAATAPQRRRRMQHPERAMWLALEPPAHLPRPGIPLTRRTEQFR